MIHAFAQHLDQWAKLRADPGLAKKAFEESLRWDGTVQTFCRSIRLTGAPVRRLNNTLNALASLPAEKVSLARGGGCDGALGKCCLCETTNAGGIIPCHGVERERHHSKSHTPTHPDQCDSGKFREQ